MNARGPIELHVVAGALRAGDGRVLVARRPEGKQLGGLWEFPGGKLEPRETPRTGLERELREELGVEVVDAEPLVAVSHTYPVRHVLLDVWLVTCWRGDPSGTEGQALDWIAPGAMRPAGFPPADVPVIAALVELEASRARE